MTDQLDHLKTALADRYAIEREIGSGGMATVYLAEDLKHRRKVAVKVLCPELAGTLGADRFVREIEIAAQLSHPHILPLYDSGEADGVLYVADEPVSALDVSVRAHILNILLRLQREEGIAMLFISHDLSVVERIADRVAVMYLGKIVEEAESDRLLDSPLHPYTQALLSSVPDPDPEAKRQRIRLTGELPSVTDPLPGCPFASRCPEVEDTCRRVAPTLEPKDSGGRVACHLR